MLNVPFLKQLFLDVVFLCASGLLLFVDPIETTLRYSVELDIQPIALDMVFGCRSVAILGRRKVVVLPMTNAERGASFAAQATTYSGDSVFGCMACSRESSLFHVATMSEAGVLMMNVRPTIPAGVSLVREVEKTRTLTQVEADELKKREENAQRYVQRKGLMLNLTANNYTESSKPMGLDFEMEGKLEDQLALAPEVTVSRVSAASPVAKSKVFLQKRKETKRNEAKRSEKKRKEKKKRKRNERLFLCF